LFAVALLKEKTTAGSVMGKNTTILFFRRPIDAILPGMVNLKRKHGAIIQWVSYLHAWNELEAWKKKKEKQEDPNIFTVNNNFNDFEKKAIAKG